jgi:hypothetical protein
MAIVAWWASACSLTWWAVSSEIMADHFDRCRKIEVALSGSKSPPEDQVKVSFLDTPGIADE